MEPALNASMMTAGALLLALGVALIAVGLSVSSDWELLVFGVILAPIGAAALEYEAATKPQAPRS